MTKTQIVTGVKPEPATVREIRREFRELLENGASLRPSGEAKDDPSVLLSSRYVPGYKLKLFDVDYYLTDQRQDDDIAFLVAYVSLPSNGRSRSIYPRIFYKDLSLVWRVATHFIHTDEENWIGKGDVKAVLIDGEPCMSSAEETTNLPYEIQAALDAISREGRTKRDLNAVPLILRRAPAHRMEPYADFTGPRRAAPASLRVNRDRPVASFERPGDPRSLTFVPGFEPDFDAGVLETARSASHLYGGPVRKYRVLSQNRLIQYQFVATLTQAWVNPPQALTTEIMSYGVRTVDVIADEDLFVPGYEYHFIDNHEDPPVLHSQIPVGYAGEPSATDPFRADASPWLDRLSVVKQFRRKVLARR